MAKGPDGSSRLGKGGDSAGRAVRRPWAAAPRCCRLTRSRRRPVAGGDEQRERHAAVRAAQQRVVTCFCRARVGGGFALLRRPLRRPARRTILGCRARPYTRPSGCVCARLHPRGCLQLQRSHASRLTIWTHGPYRCRLGRLPNGHWFSQHHARIAAAAGLRTSQRCHRQLPPRAPW